jgi:hypothetical protein
VNRVVARFIDGRVVKGTTVDFSATREFFHITDPIPVQGWNRTEIFVRELKALFYVKDFDGDPQHVEKTALDSPPPASERRVEVVFDDGEVLSGTTGRYRGVGNGFFLVPADAQSNNERCFIFDEATRDVRFM